MWLHRGTKGTGGDQEHPAAAGEGVGQRSRIVEVAVAGVGTAGTQLPQGPRTAGDEDEVLRREALQQLFGDEAAQVAGRSGDDDAHDISGRLNVIFLSARSTLRNREA